MTTIDRSAMRSLGTYDLSCASCDDCAATGCPLRGHADRLRLSTPIPTSSRRRFVAATAGVVTLAALGREVTAQEATTPTASTGDAALVCTTLTPERTEGPYYIEDALLRDDIREDREGVPLLLRMTVIDATTCEPLPDVAVDIWHCDALGDYSGVSGVQGNDDTGGQTFLRGVQLTGEDGVAAVQTIYPGWYVGRCTHIHMKVHVGGVAEDGVYEGGTTAHTGQLFFDDAVTDQVALLEPYAQHTEPRTRNDEDGILNGASTEVGVFVTLTENVPGSIGDGFVGDVTLVIDSTAESTQTGDGGPGNPPPGGG